MGLMKRGDLWYFKKMINGQRFEGGDGFADRKSAERRASEIEHDIRAGILGWKSSVPSFAEWWAIYKKTYTPIRNPFRDALAQGGPGGCKPAGENPGGI